MVQAWLPSLGGTLSPVDQVPTRPTAPVHWILQALARKNQMGRPGQQGEMRQSQGQSVAAPRESPQLLLTYQTTPPPHTSLVLGLSLLHQQESYRSSQASCGKTDHSQGSSLIFAGSDLLLDVMGRPTAPCYPESTCRCHCCLFLIAGISVKLLRERRRLGRRPGGSGRADCAHLWAWSLQEKQPWEGEGGGLLLSQDKAWGRQAHS